MTTTSPRSAPIERPPWLPWSRYPFPTRFADLDGTLVHYVDEGAGPTLLFVSAGQWSFIFRAARRSARRHPAAAAVLVRQENFREPNAVIRKH